MKCSSVKLMMHRYIENTLDTNAHNSIHEHLAKCSVCQVEVYNIQNVSSMFSNRDDVQIPEDSILSIQNAINLYRLNRNTTESGLLSTLKVLSFKSKLAYSLLTILAVLTGVFMSHDLEFTSGDKLAIETQDPTESIYKLDAFNSNADRSLYSMYTSMVMENSEEISR